MRTARTTSTIRIRISPLRKADDAVVLDNSCMTVAEQMEWFEKEFRRAIGDGR